MLWALAPAEKQTQKRTHRRVTNFERGPLLQISETYFWGQMAASTFDKWNPRLSPPWAVLELLLELLKSVTDFAPMWETHTKSLSLACYNFWKGALLEILLELFFGINDGANFRQMGLPFVRFPCYNFWQRFRNSAQAGP